MTNIVFVVVFFSLFLLIIVIIANYNNRVYIHYIIIPIILLIFINLLIKEKKVENKNKKVIDNKRFTIEHTWKYQICRRYEFRTYFYLYFSGIWIRPLYFESVWNFFFSENYEVVMVIGPVAVFYDNYFAWGSNLLSLSWNRRN